MSLYLWVILATVSGPVFLSFDKKVAFYKHFRSVFIATTLVAVPFLVWDSYFTQKGIWGFTPEYLEGIYIGNLPLEECLFFLVVPFACLFIHEVLKAYFPELRIRKLVHFFAFAMALSGFLFGVANVDHWYTASACIIAFILTVKVYFIDHSEWYQQFTLTFLVALIPFLVVNGILTGAVSDKPVVWYHADHILGIRIITIPLEDLYYNYCMLLPLTAIHHKLSLKKG